MDISTKCQAGVCDDLTNSQVQTGVRCLTWLDGDEAHRSPMTSLPTARRLSNSLLATPRTHSSLECAASASGGRHQSESLTSLTHGRSDLPDGGHQGRPPGRWQHRRQPRQASATTKSGPATRSRPIRAQEVRSHKNPEPAVRAVGCCACAVHRICQIPAPWTPTVNEPWMATERQPTRSFNTSIAPVGKTLCPAPLGRVPVREPILPDHSLPRRHRHPHNEWHSPDSPTHTTHPICREGFR